MAELKIGWMSKATEELKTCDDCLTDGKNLHSTWMIGYELTAIEIEGLDNLPVVTIQPKDPEP